nr:hypothetical protein [Tanacetum cinerariifolium]
MTPPLAPTTVSSATSILALLDFSSLFRFDQRVSTLEMELSQLKQANHFAKLLESTKSQIPTIVDDLLNEDKDEDPPAGSNQGLKKRKTSKDEELVFEAADTDMQQDQGSKFGHTVDKADSEVIPKSDWLKKPNKPPTPNYTWNDGKSIDFRPPQK